MYLKIRDKVAYIMYTYSICSCPERADPFLILEVSLYMSEG